MPHPLPFFINLMEKNDHSKEFDYSKKMLVVKMMENSLLELSICFR